MALGTVLSLIGSVSAALVGFGIGRHGGALLERLVPPAERRRAEVGIAFYALSNLL